MSMSSVCVVSNALRLRFFKPKRLFEGYADMKGENKMKKTMMIEGMMCQNCVKHVFNALSKVEGVDSVEVDLDGKKAEVVLKDEVSDDVLKEAVTEAGYEVLDIK